MAGKFMQKYKKACINGLEIEFATSGEASSIDEYVEKFVVKMGVEARSALLNIIPIMLRIKVTTVVVDSKDAVLISKATF